jgi:FkbM family methyltransferase
MRVLQELSEKIRRINWVNIKQAGFEKLRKLHKVYVSQVGQDLFLDRFIFNEKRNGFFLDIGAGDGVTFSNTYFFEEYRDWTGICVEPHADSFRLMKANRKDSTVKIQGCISEFSGETEFIQVKGYAEMLSCLKDYCTKDHMNRIHREVAHHGGQIEILSIKNININDLLKSLNVPIIDLVSLDVEGGEYSILKTIDFSEVHIDAVVVEANNNDDKINELMMSKGFKLVMKLGGLDLIYVDNSKHRWLNSFRTQLVLKKYFALRII